MSPKSHRSIMFSKKDKMMFSWLNLESLWTMYCTCREVYSRQFPLTIWSKLAIYYILYVYVCMYCMHTCICIIYGKIIALNDTKSRSTMKARVLSEIVPFPGCIRSGTLDNFYVRCIGLETRLYREGKSSAVLELNPWLLEASFIELCYPSRKKSPETS